MDALKRAEKARQAEASSDGAEFDLASTQGFSLDPIDEAGSGERRESTLDEPVPPAGSDSELSLENTRAMRGRLGLDEDEAGSASLGDSGGRSLDDSISLIDDENAIDPEHRIPHDTSATLPSVKQAQRSVDNYFDGTGSVSMTHDDLHAAMVNEATAPQQGAAADTESQRRVRQPRRAQRPQHEVHQAHRHGDRQHRAAGCPQPESECICITQTGLLARIASSCVSFVM